MNKSVIFSALIAAFSIIISFTALAQQVASEQAAACTLTVANHTDAPASVGVSGGDSMVLRAGGQGSIHTRCDILQKTYQANNTLLEKQSDTSYTMALNAPAASKKAPAKTPPSADGKTGKAPAVATAAPAKTTKLKSGSRDYIWVSSSSDICFKSSQGC